ncbi:YafY family transcriptional regulator [Clostridium butyricum]|uniref:helix-turn-helix transcriptional regulator n=1 Tax=Clostridium butyricum TaxID=1492 RepID=UPI00051C44E4|nr:YafY family protein [Clostridium butyricum]QUF83188.1 YafY family transcriptional regulator [Clostridium butyricum]
MKIDRLFSIVQMLVNRKSVTAKELADYFNVSVRTIYRDIEILSANGIPIYATQGKGGGISILENYSIDKTIVSDDEQNKIIMALQSVNATGQIDVNDSLIKLKNIFRKNDTDWIEIDFSGWEQSEEEKNNFALLKESIMNLKCVRFSYYNNKGEVSKRVVQPYKLIFKGNKWYVYGFCTNKNDFRFFKLTRIEALEVLGDTFKRIANIPINWNYDIEQSECIKIKLKINMASASRVYDEFRKGIIKIDGDYLIVEYDMPQKPWIYSYLLGYGDDLEILEPEKTRLEFKKFIGNIIQKYS